MHHVGTQLIESRVFMMGLSLQQWRLARLDKRDVVFHFRPSFGLANCNCCRAAVRPAVVNTLRTNEVVMTFAMTECPVALFSDSLPPLGDAEEKEGERGGGVPPLVDALFPLSTRTLSSESMDAVLWWARSPSGGGGCGSRPPLARGPSGKPEGWGRAGSEEPSGVRGAGSGMLVNISALQRFELNKMVKDGLN